MNMKTTQHFSKEVTLEALGCLSIQVKLEDTSERIPLKQLFEVGVRKNKKRVFLFVSKILGKHLAVDPMIPRLGGLLLAECYHKNRYSQTIQLEQLIKLLDEEVGDREAFEVMIKQKYPLKEATLFIGFAETATGLGHSMFSCFDEKATFIHTTREPIVSEKATFAFQEEHSHATGHECYTEDKAFFKRFNEIVLVDDEITTGNTALNLIKALHEKAAAKVYTVASLLDWRNKEQKQKAEDLAIKLGVKIQFISLVQGEIQPTMLQPIPEEALETKEILEVSQVNKNLVVQEASKPEARLEKEVEELLVKSLGSIQGNKASYQTLQVALDRLIIKTIQGEDGHKRDAAYMQMNGRFGLEAEQNIRGEQYLLEVGKALKVYRSYEKGLCIGTEEFIYVPCMMAYAMGKGIKYQSTTRSPIMTSMRADYPLHIAIAYKRPEDQMVINYLYNILPDTYEEVFWFFERDVADEFKMMMLEALETRGIKKVNFVCCDGNIEEDL